MLKLFKNSFKTTNDCIILATPLILFLSILSWYFDYALKSIDNTSKLILAIVTIFIMGSGFAAAWIYMAKKTITLSRKIFVFDKDRAKALGYLIMSLPRGIGKLFLPIIGVISIYALILILMFSGIGFIVDKLAGTISLDFDITNIQTFLVSSDELLSEIKELPKQDILIINYWYFLSVFGIALTTFITMLWVPEIVYAEKNSFKALYYSVIKIFKNFKKSVILYLYISFLIVLITILNTLLMFNPILYFLVLMLYYYFLVYIVVLLFSYYEQTFIYSE